MEEVLSYGLTFLSDINFMLAMLVVVLVSACFLGRYVVITRKMVIATLGILAFQIIFIIVFDLIIKAVNPDMYKYLDNVGTFDYITEDNPYYEGIALYSAITSIVINSGVFIYAFIFYLLAYKEKRFLRAVESTICLYLLYYYVNSMVQYIYVYFKGGKYEVLEDALYTLGGKDKWIYTAVAVGVDIVVYAALLLILYFGYFKKKRFYVVRVRDRILFIVWLIIFSIFPAMPFGLESVDEKYKMLSMVFGSLIPVLGGLAPILLIMNAAEKNLKEKNEYQETYLTAELEYIERYKHSQEETRAFRHDIINNLSLTQMMLEEGKTEDANEHLKQLLGNVRALSPSIITGDEMLDCIVAMKADKMKERGIGFNLDGVVDGGLHMKPMDVCSIFANALDNAIEASSKLLPDSENAGSKKANTENAGSKKTNTENAGSKKANTENAGSKKANTENAGSEISNIDKEESKPSAWVDMNIKRTEKFFVIKIANASSQMVDVEKLFMSSGYTSKKDKEHHGFGLRNIRMAVEEYDGLVKAESDENSFSLSIMIPRK